MRVLGMVSHYPPDHCAGSELMVHALLRALAAAGHDVDVVLSRATGKPYELDGIHVWPHRDKTDPFRFLSGASLIVTHLDDTTRATTIGQMYGVVVAQILHNDNGHTSSYVKRGGASLVVFNSDQMARTFAGYTGRSIVIRPPVDPREYTTTPGDRVTLINLSEDKGASTFYGLAERFGDVEFMGVRGAYGEQVVRTLPNVEIIDHLAPGRMRDEVYARTRILLMPSAHESWGRTGTEAMTSGIPVIAAPTAGLLESLGPAGIFAQAGDVDAWATELRRLGNPAEWDAASAKARIRAAQLDPAADLALWRQTVEEMAHGRARARR